MQRTYNGKLPRFLSKAMIKHKSKEAENTTERNVFATLEASSNGEYVGLSSDVRDY